MVALAQLGVMEPLMLVVVVVLLNIIPLVMLVQRVQAVLAAAELAVFTLLRQQLILYQLMAQSIKAAAAAER
jgi:hypothetical protein